MGSVPEKTVDRHPMSLQTVRPEMAKAHLKNVQMRDFAVEIGRAIERAISVVGWTKKEAAAHIGISQPQLSAWLAGHERPHFDRLCAVEPLFWPLIQSLAQLDTRVEVTTEIKRRA